MYFRKKPRVSGEEGLKDMKVIEAVTAALLRGKKRQPFKFRKKIEEQKTYGIMQKSFFYCIAETRYYIMKLKTYSHYF
jgi:hypothetical protein